MYDEKEIIGEKSITPHFGLHKKDFGFPLPLVWYFGDAGDFSLSFQLPNKDLNFKEFELQNFQIFSNGKAIYKSNNPSIFKRERFYIEGKEINTSLFYKTGYTIKIPKEPEELKLNINFRLVDQTNKVFNFNVEKVFDNNREKGFGSFL